MIDLIVVCFLVIFAATGAHRGFVRAGVRLLGAALAAYLASVLGGMLAQWAFQTLFRDALVEHIGEALDQAGAGNLAVAVQQLYEGLPDFIQRGLTSAGVTVESLLNSLSTQTGRVAEFVADALSPVFVNFLKVLAVIVLFMLLMIAVRLASDLLGRTFRLPILRQLDHALGGIFGLLLAVFALWIVAAALGVFLPLLTQETRGDVEYTLEKTWIAGKLLGLDPLSGLFR